MNDVTFGDIADSFVESVTDEEGGEYRFIQRSQYNGMVSYEYALPGERWETLYAEPNDVVFLDNDSLEAVKAALLQQ